MNKSYFLAFVSILSLSSSLNAPHLPCFNNYVDSVEMTSVEKLNDLVQKCINFINEELVEPKGFWEKRARNKLITTSTEYFLPFCQYNIEIDISRINIKDKIVVEKACIGIFESLAQFKKYFEKEKFLKADFNDKKRIFLRMLIKSFLRQITVDAEARLNINYKNLIVYLLHCELLEAVFLKNNNSVECPLCLEDLISREEDKDLSLDSNCGVYFHRSCLRQDPSPACPSCRQPLTSILNVPCLINRPIKK